MAGVAVATPTLPVPHQHLALWSLLATRTTRQISHWPMAIPITNFGKRSPRMETVECDESPEEHTVCSTEFLGGVTFLMKLGAPKNSKQLSTDS